MITVKGTKSENTGAAPRDAYAEKAESRESRTPFVVGMLLSAVALYLRTALHGKAAALPEAEDATQVENPRREASAEGPEQYGAEQLIESKDSNPRAASKSRAYSDDGYAMVTSPSWGSAIQMEPARHTPSPAANLNNLPYLLTQEADFRPPVTGDASNEIKAGHDASAPAPPPPMGDPPPRRNTPPRPIRPPYLFNVDSGTVTLIALADLLAQVEDSNGDTLRIVDASVASGQLVPTEGGFLYLSDPDTVGPVELRYLVSDGMSVLPQVAHLAVTATVAEGTEGDDSIVGSPFADELRGKSGNDNINAGHGRDVVSGGAGDDRISGGAGNDLIFGGDGNDVILGGAGNDSIFGEDGDDLILGDAGNDTISGGLGRDRIAGGDGSDALMGDAGDDILTDGAGSDTVAGGNGKDVVLASADGQDDYLDGGADLDTLDYSDARSGIVIDVVNGAAMGDAIGDDEITGFEIIVAGAGNDRIVAGLEDLVLRGGAGDDRFEFVDEVPTAVVMRTIHQILDFAVGDRIIAKGLELFDGTGDDASALLDVLAGSQAAGAQLPQIRLSYSTVEDYDQTLIEWDCDAFDAATTVIVNGHHIFNWSAATQS